jgi:tripeptidyl-peptidase-2
MHFSPSAMPKDETGVTKLLQSHPEADGRGILVAILDTGCDLAAAGLQQTSDGKPKYVDFLDCTGGGDIDTKAVAERQPDGSITGLSGRTLQLGSWGESAAELRLGAFRLFSLLPRSVLGRVKRERKASFEATQHAAVTAVQREMDALEGGAVTGAAKAAAKKVCLRAGRQEPVGGQGREEGSTGRGGRCAATDVGS